MLRFFGNTGAPDMPSELWLDPIGMEELYRLHDVNSYGQVAPSRRLATAIVVVGQETARDHPEDASRPVEKGPTA